MEFLPHRVFFFGRARFCTLVEFVAIAIIGVLVSALLLPARSNRARGVGPAACDSVHTSFNSSLASRMHNFTMTPITSFPDWLFVFLHVENDPRINRSG